MKNDLFLAGDRRGSRFAYFENTTDNYIGREFVGGEAMMFFNYDYVRFKGSGTVGRI